MSRKNNRKQNKTEVEVIEDTQEVQESTEVVEEVTGETQEPVEVTEEAQEVESTEEATEEVTEEVQEPVEVVEEEEVSSNTGSMDSVVDLDESGSDAKEEEIVSGDRFHDEFVRNEIDKRANDRLRLMR